VFGVHPCFLRSVAISNRPGNAPVRLRHDGRRQI
jgi:hypothetical protein